MKLSGSFSRLKGFGSLREIVAYTVWTLSPVCAKHGQCGRPARPTLRDLSREPACDRLDRARYYFAHKSLKNIIK